MNPQSGYQKKKLIHLRLYYVKNQIRTKRLPILFFSLLFSKLFLWLLFFSIIYVLIILIKLIYSFTASDQSVENGQRKRDQLTSSSSVDEKLCTYVYFIKFIFSLDCAVFIKKVDNRSTHVKSSQFLFFIFHLTSQLQHCYKLCSNIIVQYQQLSTF